MLRTVQTENGTLQGVPCGDPRITVFKGVPYAAPPVGELRWRSPQPAESWEGVRRADTYAPMAWQAPIGGENSDFFTKEMHPAALENRISEDCLYFNLWSPARSTADKLPIFVWFHGGGLQTGYSYEMESNGERMAREGVIVVSVGYRLNVFGFLAHPELTAEDPDGCHGNYCLEDVLYCVRYLKRNARAFGGDPDRITVGGQSGSAFGSQVLAVSPLSKGLITGIIMQSGGGLRALGYPTGCNTLAEAEQYGVELLDSLGVKTIAEARQLPAERIFDAYRRMPGGFARWSPRIDGKLLTEESTQAMIRGHYNDIPYLYGSTANEGGFIFAPGKPPETAAELREHALPLFGGHTDEILSAYRLETPEDVLRVFRGDGFNSRTVAARAFALVQAEQGTTGYCYFFNHDIPGEDHPGAYHGSDLWFTFRTLDLCWRPFEGRHYDLARKVCKYWTNFIKTGDPNGPDQDGTPLPEWRPVTREDLFVMEFADEPRRLEPAPDPAAEWRIRKGLGRL